MIESASPSREDARADSAQKIPVTIRRFGRCQTELNLAATELVSSLRGE